MAETDKNLRVHEPTSCCYLSSAGTCHLPLAHPVSYGAGGGHALNPSPLGVKCAEQTDPGITQRLDTLAGYLRAESS